MVFGEGQVFDVFGGELNHSLHHSVVSAPGVCSLQGRGRHGGSQWNEEAGWETSSEGFGGVKSLE